MADIKQDEKDSQYEALLNSNFKQQKLSAWRPVPTIASTTITFIVFGIVFIIIGVIVLIFSNQIIDISVRYDLQCGKNQTNCVLPITITEKMKQPVMVYYQLNNFYQNHRRYVKSKSNSQLSGDVLTADQIEADCDPVFKNKHLNVKYAYFKDSNNNPVLLDPEAAANPCGLIAKSLFNDTYNLTASTSETPLFINETGIAWQSDIDLKYDYPPNYKEVLWTDTKNEHFMVWMRPAGLPNFRKLWGRIQQDLEPGEYKITINNYYDVQSFEGEKYFVLSTVNAFGGKNSFLGISYICVGGICLVMALLFFFGYKSHSKTS
jgi:hypothetical protein